MDSYISNPPPLQNLLVVQNPKLIHIIQPLYFFLMKGRKFSFLVCFVLLFLSDDL